jgi:hypothetical protein
MGVQARRRRIPVSVLWLGGLLLRPFNEVASRLMRRGYFTVTRDGSFADWGSLQSALVYLRRASRHLSRRSRARRLAERNTGRQPAR